MLNAPRGYKRVGGIKGKVLKRISQGCSHGQSDVTKYSVIVLVV